MTSSSPDVESTPPPAVSSLRSRFEKLAADETSHSIGRQPSNHDLLSPDSNPRPRALSGGFDSRPESEVHTLRAASSSSDLKAAAKRPPPPPPPLRPSRAASPAPPSVSPLLQAVPEIHPPPPVPDSTPGEQVQMKLNLLSRKPPPPPPSHTRPDVASVERPSDIASLIDKFGRSPSPVIPARPPHPSAHPQGRILSHTIALHPPPPADTAESQRKPRHSFPMHPIHHAISSRPSTSNSSLASASDSGSSGRDTCSYESSDSDGTVAAEPPPLPSRRGGVHKSASEPAPIPDQHGRERSGDSVTSSGSSRLESEGESTERPGSVPQLSPLSRPFGLPPRPPPRKKSSVAPGVTSPSSSTTSLTPPPLPARKSPATPVEEQARRLPPRHQNTTGADTQGLSAEAPSPSISPPSERKAFGHHPPPPTRTIQLGDRLPPPRRAPSGSSSESGEDEEARKIELLPDTSRSSRAPPTIDCHEYSESNIHVPAYSSAVAVSGHSVAVATHHHLKIYDLSVSESPLWNIDTKDSGLDTRLKELKVTSLEFRPARAATDRGYFLWLGTKDGHLIEMDVRTGEVSSVKYSAHSHTVTHIFRHGRSMITVDDTGKVLVFLPDVDSADDVKLTTLPRVVRIADKQEFAKMLGGQLWTSTRDPNNGGSAASTSRGPIVRVYDIFKPGSAGRSLLPTEHLGAITSGTILPSQPDHVYLGHEGGYVSIWSLITEDGVPKCEEVMKVSTSDVLSLEGVNNRLWAGGRNGSISAFDVVSRPWVVSNCWQAHTKLPVLRIAVDTWSIEKLGRLTVFSVGRDERLRFWDGLLGTDWIDQELLKRETEFSSFRQLKVLIISWNVDSAKPDQMTGAQENVNFLHDVLTSVDSPDIVSFGLQELIDLESRKMAAKTVLLGGKNKAQDGAISQKVTTSYKKWYDRLVLAVRLAMPPDCPYTVIHTENLVGLFSCIFVKNAERNLLKHVAITTVKRGMGGRYGNKGGIVARFVVDDTSVCFINCHLAAGQHHVRQRNADIAAILEDKTVLPESEAVDEALAYVNGGNGSMVLDHEVIYVNGDMNYRIDQRREAVISAIKADDLESLLVHDQLLKEIKHNRGFRMRSFMEGPLTFSPTYKYDRRSTEYDTSEKARVPAWCDRVLWRARDPSRVHQLHYKRYEANISDHRPISAGFQMTVKKVNREKRAQIRVEVQAVWSRHEQELIHAAQQFFLDQGMI
ncbi:hypothetical protein CERSUDRAFT_127167 [Gelatoporia subvermispora B]|uniref:Inositol polyphosphate-related phosphatase domain-containing protein n=1 Tax=Ceriporiopsis subvermispora (strain B) TaxID=914234 RepID=M2R0L2_CERS8|nr:hypothetical protein CERSUDRAFT_127167 [Gelatoporia subvermispora B]